MIFIIKSEDVQNIDFSKCLETSMDTLQFSLNGEKTYITTEDESALNGVQYIGQYEDYTFTRGEEWWRESFYGETL